MTILVTGATGNVGSATLAALRAANADVRVAAWPGDPSPPDGSVPFDFTDEATWPGAFVGAQSLFLVRPPAIGNVRRDLLPAVAAARDSGVRHVVFLSLQGADRIPVVPHAKVEKWLRSSGVDWTFVRASFFHQNMSTTHCADIRDSSEIPVPAGKGRTAFVDAVDVGEVAAQALLEGEAHRNRVLTVTGPEALDYDEVALILSDVLGRSIRYTRPGLLSYIRHARRDLGMPLGKALVTAVIYTTARLGLADSLTDDVRTVLSREPTAFRAFAEREQEVWERPPPTVSKEAR